MTSTLELAIVASEAIAARNSEDLEAVLSSDVLLDAPMPLGVRHGSEKVAKTMIRFAKLGVSVLAPSETDGQVRSDIESPAGSMILTYESHDGAIQLLKVTAP